MRTKKDNVTDTFIGIMKSYAVSLCTYLAIAAVFSDFSIECIFVVFCIYSTISNPFKCAFYIYNQPYSTFQMDHKQCKICYV